jgi:hypothetical protein
MAPQIVEATVNKSVEFAIAARKSTCEPDRLNRKRRGRGVEGIDF